MGTPLEYKERIERALDPNVVTDQMLFCGKGLVSENGQLKHLRKLR